APIHRMDDSGRRERQCSIWCASQPRFAASIAGQPIHGTYLGFKTGKGGDPSETPAARRNTRPKSPNRAERKPTALTYVNSNRRASRSANCWGRWRIEFQSTGARYKRDVIADLRTFEAPSRTQDLHVEAERLHSLGDRAKASWEHPQTGIDPGGVCRFNAKP